MTPAKLKSNMAPAYVRPLHLALFGVARHAAKAVDEALEPPESLLEEHGLAVVDPRHVAAERLHREDDRRQQDGDLRPTLPAHENASGLSKATKR